MWPLVIARDLIEDSRYSNCRAVMLSRRCALWSHGAVPASSRRFVMVQFRSRGRHLLFHERNADSMEICRVAALNELDESNIKGLCDCLETYWSLGWSFYLVDRFTSRRQTNFKPTSSNRRRRQTRFPLNSLLTCAITCSSTVYRIRFPLSKDARSVPANLCSRQRRATELLESQSIKLLRTQLMDASSSLLNSILKNWTVSFNVKGRRCMPNRWMEIIGSSSIQSCARGTDWIQRNMKS